ncbi:MAG TPA: CBS domain-containing protein [Candidatus Polarisedimenticolia bacterium]|nr:CBS domain-containing protein [Candidatus Polarisedimenticolia bacterium]
MRIGDIMTRPVAVCRPEDTLEEAARLMWECDCGFVPVVDEQNRVAGTVTDRDICMAAYTKGKALRDLRVAETMAREVFWSREEDDIEQAERMMADKQVRRLPVLDRDHRPVGVVSLGDLARLAARVKSGRGGEREVASSLAEISRPRQEAMRSSRPGEGRDVRP